MLVLMIVVAVTVAVALATLIKIREAQLRADLERRNDRLTGFGVSYALEHQSHASLVEE